MAKSNNFAEMVKSSLDKLKPAPEQIYNIHNSLRRMTNQFDSPGPEMEHIRDFNVPHAEFPIPVRLYEPQGLDQAPGPTLVYLHGGGFVTCNLESHDGICRRVASGSGYRVLSVDYRLAPQYPYPAGPDDSETVLNWVLDGYGHEEYGMDRHRIAIGGDSAGGNMAAYLAQKYRDRLFAQILFYPLMQLVDFKPPNPGPQDWLQLGVMALKFIDQHYVAGADRTDTRLSPLLESDLSGLPPAYILTCGLDPLRDEGKEYADNLAGNGVEILYHHEKAMPHGFLNFARAFPKAQKLPLDAADFLLAHTQRIGNPS